MNLMIQPGTTDVSVTIRIVNATTGAPETGVVFNTSGIDLWYRREGAVAVDITEADLATPALTDAHADGGFLAIGDGWYRLDLPDAACATGVAGVQIGGTVTGMVVIAPYIQLVDQNTAIGGAVTTITNAIDALNDLSATDVGGVLEDYQLHQLLNVAVDPANITNNSALARIMAASGTASDFTGATDALDALGAAIVTIDGIVDDILADTGTDGVALSAAALAAVNGEVDDVINTDANAEPTAVPAANASLGAKIAWACMRQRNRRTSTATTETVYADDGTTPIATSTVSDDDTTTTRGEYTDAT